MEARVRLALLEMEIADIDLDVGLREAPFYNPGEPLPVLRLITSAVTVWLFDASAHFEMPGAYGRLDRESAATDEEFSLLFCLALQEALSEHHFGI